MTLHCWQTASSPALGADGKVASNVVATLLPHRSPDGPLPIVRANTSLSDFDADLICLQQPYSSRPNRPGRMRPSMLLLWRNAPKLMLDLDTIGERNKGPLPCPLGYPGRIPDTRQAG